MVAQAVRAPVPLAFQGQPRFRADVNVVQLDATVIDRGGRPIRGLSAADFTIRENGQPRSIVDLTEVILETANNSPALAPGTAPDVAVNQEPEGRLIALVMDDAMLPPDAAFVRAAKKIGHGETERLHPQSAITQAAIGNRQSPIANQQSAIVTRQSAID